MPSKVFKKKDIVEFLTKIQLKAKTYPNLVLYFIDCERQKQLFSKFVVEGSKIRLFYHSSAGNGNEYETEIDASKSKEYEYFETVDSMTFRGRDVDDEFFSVALRDKNHFKS